MGNETEILATVGWHRPELLAREIFKAFQNDCFELKIYELDCWCFYYRRAFVDGQEDDFSLFKCFFIHSL